MNQEQIEKIILSGGGEIPPKGVGGQSQHGFLVYFNESTTGSTLTCHLSDLSIELVKAKIRDKRAEYAAREEHRTVNAFLWAAILVLVIVCGVVVYKHVQSLPDEKNLTDYTIDCKGNCVAKVLDSL
jgi:hypothetical protein